MSRNPPTRADWEAWARKDLWSQNEFCQLCAGLLPGTPNRTDTERALIREAGEAIARGTLSETLAFVPRDDADTAAVMYDTARHYVPAIAGEWAAPRFDTFPSALLDAVRKRAQSASATSAATSWPWGNYQTEALRQLAAAVQRFWVGYDPVDPSTANTNETVSNWLQSRGVSKRVAEVMAQIIRADGLRTGPR